LLLAGIYSQSFDSGPAYALMPPFLNDTKLYFIVTTNLSWARTIRQEINRIGLPDFGFSDLQ